MKILAATNNAHKLGELRAILAPLGIEVLGASDVGGIPEVDEDQDTFVGNATKKAVETAKAVNLTVFADDSGLEVFAINREPGIYSARYADTDATKMAKVLSKLDAQAQTGNADRTARFVCVIALASPDGLIGTAEGEVRGTIADAPRGNGGFGYDPIFIPEGYHQTFAELGSELKDSMSHRGNALRKAVTNGLFTL